MGKASLQLFSKLNSLAKEGPKCPHRTSYSLTDLCAQGLNVVFKGGVHPLQCFHCVLVSADLLRQFLLLIQDSSQDLLGIVVELMELEGGSKDLCPGVNELQQVSPSLVQPILPLRHRCRIAVPSVDQLVCQTIDAVHTFLTNVPRVPGKLPETFLQHLSIGETVKRPGSSTDIIQ